MNPSSAAVQPAQCAGGKYLVPVTAHGYISRHWYLRSEPEECKVIPASMQNVNVQKKGCRAVQSAPFCLMVRMILLLLVLLAMGAVSARAVSPATGNASVRGSASMSEVRGLWVVRNSVVNLGQAERLVRFADSLGCNVLFVQARGRGDAWYRSELSPGPDEYPDIPMVFDPLTALIPLAHARGIEVHAWLNLCLTWSERQPPSRPDHVLRAHPDWFMVSMSGISMSNCPFDSVSTGTVEGRYLSPGLASVREYLARVAREIAERYPIDGVHLDYVRYPGWGYDFHPRVRSEFTRRYGLDPRAAVTGEGKADPRLTVLGKWVEFRAGKMDALVREVALAVRRVDSRLRVSAAVKADPEDAYYLHGQDWPGWLRDGAVDFVVTMNFVAQNGKFRDILHSSLRKVDRGKVIAGIGVWQLTPEQALEQVECARKSGLPGYCLFSYSACSDNPAMQKSLMKLVRTGGRGLPPEFKPYLRKTR